MNGGGAPAFAAVDWGTSRFRLFLMDAAGEVLAECRSEDGLDAARAKGFGLTLETELQALEAPDGLPVVICGMAGSRQGWIEAPYFTIPAAANEIFASAVIVPHEARPVRMIPGLAQRGAHPDVMRGEETKLLALAAGEPGLTATVMMPGTHCKWVGLEDGAIAHFSTCPTGELFALLSGQSILRHSIGDAAGSVEADDPEFLRALDETLADPASLLGRLFPIRAATLLDGLSPQAAAARLSGLLIGAEVGAALPDRDEDERTILVSFGPMARLYEMALTRACVAHETADADAAARRGLFTAAKMLWPERFEAMP